jgi:hypothetical protein
MDLKEVFLFYFFPMCVLFFIGFFFQNVLGSEANRFEGVDDVVVVLYSFSVDSVLFLKACLQGVTGFCTWEALHKCWLECVVVESTKAILLLYYY